MSGNGDPSDKTEERDACSQKVKGDAGYDFAEEKAGPGNWPVNQKCPQIIVGFIVNLKPPKQQAENGAQPPALFGQGIEWLQALDSGRVKVSENVGIRSRGDDQQHRPNQLTEQRPFKVLAQFFLDECFHGCASASERMKDFSPRSPK